MLEGITPERVAAMSEQERRWLENVKEAFYESDKAYMSDRPEDHSFEYICKAIDVAKTLRRSLRGEDCSAKQNKARLTEYIDWEIPGFSEKIPLIDAREQRSVSYSYSELIYAIRCSAVHENENLNAAEKPDFHVLLDWTMSPDDRCGGVLRDGQIILNARDTWLRLRELMVKFIQAVDMMIAFTAGAASGSLGRAALGSIRPATARSN
jgi:hypothetical protein